MHVTDEQQPWELTRLMEKRQIRPKAAVRINLGGLDVKPSEERVMLPGINFPVKKMIPFFCFSYLKVVSTINRGDSRGVLTDEFEISDELAALLPDDVCTNFRLHGGILIAEEVNLLTCDELTELLIDPGKSRQTITV